MFSGILGIGVTHHVTLHSSPLGQLTNEMSFSVNITGGNTSTAIQNVDNIALLSYAEDSFSSSLTKNNSGKPDKTFLPTINTKPGFATNDMTGYP